MAKKKDFENCKSVAYFFVPPFLKYAAGPLLGPAILKGAAESEGVHLKVLDLNIEYMRSHGLQRQMDSSQRVPFYGNHAKQSESLDAVEQIFWGTICSAFGTNSDVKTVSDVRKAWYSHGQLYNAVERLQTSEMGRLLEDRVNELTSPIIAGVSVMWSGQIVPALMLSRVIKTKWDTRVVWGGAHVTALIREVMQDKEFGRWVDGFLPGHCEESFVELIKSTIDGKFDCPGLTIPGRGKPQTKLAKRFTQAMPIFTDLDLYGIPRLMLPIELSVGCPFARCIFCTYPSIEGRYKRFPLDTLRKLTPLAEREHAAISLKDSLVPADMLKAVAKEIQGRVEWSACTKLAWSLDSKLLSFLAKNGCRTLEIGIESLDQDTQRRIEKIQSISLLDNLLMLLLAPKYQ